MRLLILSCLVAFGADWSSTEAGEFSIDTNFPGGIVVVERVDGDTVYLRPDLRDTAGWWFYWNFRVADAEGRSLTSRFSERNPIGARGHGQGWRGRRGPGQVPAARRS